MAIPLKTSSSSSLSTQMASLGNRTVLLLSTAPDGQAEPLTEKDGLALADAIRSAKEQQIPFIAFLKTTGSTPQEGSQAAYGWARAARELSQASGIIPTMIAVCGPVISGASLLLGLADITAFTEESYAFISGPKSIERYTGNPVTIDSLGGAGTHARTTGLATFLVDDEDEAKEVFTNVLQYLPNNVNELPHAFETSDPIERATPEAGDLIPTAAMGAYDVRNVIQSITDHGEFLELREAWAPNLVTGFAHMGGQSVGIVANQTQALAGSIDIPASQKGARFVSMCDAFNIPLLTLVDTSGFLPGKDLEWRGMIRHGAQLAFAYARATVPRVALILRKSYGGAYIVMDSRHMGNDLMFAWPSAEVAVMGAKGAVQILHRKASPEEKLLLEQEYEEQYLAPYPAAERCSISAIIKPTDTRKELANAFKLLNTKRERLRPRKHDNCPL